MPENEGVKYDEGKLRFDLIPPKELRELAQIYTVGAKKYAPRNWENGMSWGRIYAALQRHLNAFWAGESNDPEDGLSHLMHAAWCCITLRAYEKNFQEHDDRSKL